MAYALIQPPFTLKFREMSKQDLKDYSEWFHVVLLERICELAKAVGSTPGFEAWRPDCRPSSLQALGDWFAGMVETRARTPEELDEIKGRSAFPIDVPEEELTNKTLSLSMDVGIYFSQVILTQHKSVKWHQPLDDKKFVDYGQPVLLGFGRVPLNPVRIIINLAYGIASGKQTGSRLKELHDYWSRLAGTK